MLLPYNNENMLDVKNLVIVSVIFIVSVTSIFCFFHQIIDKLFFRKFYEKPRLGRSIRRGFFLGALLVGLFWLRIFGFWEFHIVLLLFILIMLLEAFFIVLTAGYDSRSKTGELKEEELRSKD